MSTLTVVRLRTIDHEQGWHWAIRMDTVSSARVCFFDATMGFGWDGFKQRERPFETSGLAASQMPPIVDEHLIGVIPHNIHDAALQILRTCLVKSDERWNCQDWVRECISLLDEAGAITKPSSEVRSAWNDGILAQRDAGMPVFMSKIQL